MQVEGVCRRREDVRSSVQATATREVHPLQRNGTADRGGRSMPKDLLLIEVESKSEK